MMIFRWVFLLAVVLSVQDGALLAEPDASVRGLWSGGFGSLSANDPSWDTMSFRIESVTGTRVAGVASTSRGEEPLKGEISGEGMELRLRRGRNALRFAGQLKDGRYEGICRVGSKSHDFIFVWEDPPGETAQAQCAGFYEVGPDHKIIVRKSIHLVLQDFESGECRVLYARGGDRYVAGPSFGVPYPTAWTLSFHRDETGSVTELVVEDGSSEPLHAKRRVVGTQEPFEFSTSDGVTIRGTLFLPQGEGRRPAVVWVHGSGRAKRQGVGSWAAYLQDLGFAVLAVDKRGVGESDGRYELPDGGHDNRPHMKRRAGDVRAAMDALKKRKDIHGNRVGLMGASQAGWVIPMAAQKGGVAFAITLSGGATALSFENVFSDWAKEADSGPDAPPLDEVLARVRKHKPRDPDFREYFAAMDCPGLWLYGDRDRSNPSQLCVELIESIKEEHRKDFTVVLFPTGNHALMDCRNGGAAENGALSRKVPGLYSTVEEWLTKLEL